MINKAVVIGSILQKNSDGITITLTGEEPTIVRVILTGSVLEQTLAHTKEQDLISVKGKLINTLDDRLALKGEKTIFLSPGDINE